MNLAALRAVDQGGTRAGASCTEKMSPSRSRTLPSRQGRTVRYICQTTQLCNFTKPLSWWNLSSTSMTTYPET